MGPRYLQSQIHTDYATGSNVWSEYRSQIKSMYDSFSNKEDFNDHLIREYNRKIERLNQQTGLYIAPFDGGFRFIGDSITSVGGIVGFAYPNETLTAPSGSSYLWTVNGENRGINQTFVPTVNDIGEVVTCLVGSTTYTTTVWHPRDISSVQAFWWAAKNAYNVIGNNFTDANRTIQLSGFPILTTAVSATNPNTTISPNGLKNGKTFYSVGSNPVFNDRYITEVFWDNINSRWTLFYQASENEEGTSWDTREKYAVGNTEYPWQATWADGTLIGTPTTTSTLATDGQTVPAWDDIISNQRATASSSNIARKEDTDLGGPSLKFDSTDFYALPFSARVIYDDRRWGYIFVGAKDSNPYGGDNDHGLVSINRSTTVTKIGLRTRDDQSFAFSARTSPIAGFPLTIVTSSDISNSNYNVLTNESLWAAGKLALRINGVEDNFDDSFGGTVSNSTSTASYIGATTSTTAGNFNGDITAVILASNIGESDEMSEVDRNRLERFIGLLGGLDIPLISNVAITYIRNIDYSIETYNLTTIPDNWQNDDDNIASVFVGGVVTSIGNNAFYSCSGLASVTIPNSVTSIGVYAFGYCTGLTSITIPNGVTSIGNGAFNGCGSLTSITIPNSVTSIGDYAFSFSGLTSATIGSGVTSIDNGAFEECDSLTSITIPNSVTSIGDYAFSGCDSMTTATIGSGVTSIGSFAFAYCGLTSITIPNSVTSIGNGAFQDCTGLTTATIGSGVTSIGDYAFQDCIGLTSATIGSSVTSIGRFAFDTCTSLTSITIPNSVTSIGNSAFLNCTSLTSATIGSGVTSIGAYVFNTCTSLTSITIPNSVTSIGSFAFAYCGLTSITIPNSVTSISEGAFQYCTSLTSATIGSGVTSISNNTFANSGLTSITIPNSVTSIGTYAFYGCAALTNATIGSGVTSIGFNAFRGCAGLTSMTIPNNVTSIGGSTFRDCSSLDTLNCYVTRTIMNQSSALVGTATPFTIYARATDATWTAGADTIGGKSVTVVKNL